MADVITAHNDLKMDHGKGVDLAGGIAGGARGLFENVPSLVKSGLQDAEKFVASNFGHFSISDDQPKDTGLKGMLPGQTSLPASEAAAQKTGLVPPVGSEGPAKPTDHIPPVGSEIPGKLGKNAPIDQRKPIEKPKIIHWEQH